MSRHRLITKVQYLPLVLGIIFFQSLSKIQTIGEGRKDRNKDRFKNWQLCSVWKFLFCDHTAIKLTQNCACFTNPCVNFHVQSLANATVLGIITNGISVGFKSSRVKELGSGPIRLPRCAAGAKWLPISGVTNGDQMANPPWKTRCRNRDPLSWYFGFSILLVFNTLLFFWFPGVFFGDLEFQYNHPHPDSSSFLNFFECWLLGPLQLAPFSKIYPLVQTSIYFTASSGGWLEGNCREFFDRTFCVEPQRGVSDERDTLCDVCDSRLYWSILHISFW